MKKLLVALILLAGCAAAQIVNPGGNGGSGGGGASPAGSRFQVQTFETSTTFAGQEDIVAQQAAFSTPPAPTVTNVGAAGLASISYFCAVGGYVSVSAESSATVNATSNATLNNTNYNHIACPLVAGAFFYVIHKDDGGGDIPIGFSLTGAFDDKGYDKNNGITFLNDAINAGPGWSVTTPILNYNFDSRHIVTRPITGTCAPNAATSVLACVGTLFLSEVKPGDCVVLGYPPSNNGTNPTPDAVEVSWVRDDLTLVFQPNSCGGATVGTGATATNLSVISSSFSVSAAANGISWYVDVFDNLWTSSDGSATQFLGGFPAGSFCTAVESATYTTTVQQCWDGVGAWWIGNSAKDHKFLVDIANSLVSSDFQFKLNVDVVNPFIQTKNTQAATAPGATLCDLRWIAGTIGSSGKIVAACGTSATEVTIADNVGAGF